MSVQAEGLSSSDSSGSTSLSFRCSVRPLNRLTSWLRRSWIATLPTLAADRGRVLQDSRTEDSEDGGERGKGQFVLCPSLVIGCQHVHLTGLHRLVIVRKHVTCRTENIKKP